MLDSFEMVTDSTSCILTHGNYECKDTLLIWAYLDDLKGPAGNYYSVIWQRTTFHFSLTRWRAWSHWFTYFSLSRLQNKRLVNHLRLLFWIEGPSPTLKLAFCYPHCYREPPNSNFVMVSIDGSWINIKTMWSLQIFTVNSTVTLVTIQYWKNNHLCGHYLGERGAPVKTPHAFG